MYDITDAESFEKVKNWVKELRKIVGDNICIAMAGNKIDLEKDRHVKESDALAYAKSVGAVHMHTSAKANKGVDEIFTELAVRMLDKRKKEKGNSATSPAGAGGKQKLVIVDEAPPPKKGGCC